LQGMFTDVQDESLNDMNQRFQDYNTGSNKINGLELEVQVRNKIQNKEINKQNKTKENKQNKTKQTKQTNNVFLLLIILFFLIGFE